jgi:hypothetical protein
LFKLSAPSEGEIIGVLLIEELISPDRPGISIRIGGDVEHCGKLAHSDLLQTKLYGQAAWLVFLNTPRHKQTAIIAILFIAVSQD